MFKKIISLFKRNQPFRPLYASEFLQVFSHPRSGTHFLEAFIGWNFYAANDLSIKPIEWGHWSNRQINHVGNGFGKLFGSHAFPLEDFRKIDYPAVYIARDGRAVAYSIWKTRNFLNPKYEGISFSDFLRLKLDWIGSPAFRAREKYNVAVHWDKHVRGWHKISKSNPYVLFIRYEDLVRKPYMVYEQLYDQFFSGQAKLKSGQLDRVTKPIGLLPNKAEMNSWQKVFSDSDNQYFRSCIKSSEYLQD